MKSNVCQALEKSLHEKIRSTRCEHYYIQMGDKKHCKKCKITVSTIKVTKNL